jgi:hypothetical protein
MNSIENPNALLTENNNVLTTPNIITIMNETHPKNNTTSTDSLYHVGSKVQMSQSGSVFVDEKNAITLYFEGTLYNTLELYNMLYCRSNTSKPIHEIILLLYKRFGFHYMMQLLNGLFYIVLLDNNIYNEQYLLYVATDIFSSKPFYLSIQEENLYNVFYIHTQPIQIKNKYESCVVQPKRIVNERFPPGTYSAFHLSHKVFSFWEEEHRFSQYHHLPLHWNQLELKGINRFFHLNLPHTIKQIQQLKENIKLEFENTIHRQIYNVLYHKRGVFCWELPTPSLSSNSKMEIKTEGECFEDFLNVHYNDKNVHIEIDTSGMDELFGKDNHIFDNIIEYDIYIREQMMKTPVTVPVIADNMQWDMNTIVVYPYLDKDFILFILSIYPKIRDLYRMRLLPGSFDVPFGFSTKKNI